MKVDIFSHIMPQAYYDRMIELDRKGKDMDKRIRAASALVNLDERFRGID